jgi:hypothetical protein
MGIIGKDFKYKKIENFLSKDELELANYYMLLKHKKNQQSFDLMQSNNYDSYFYEDPFAESLLMLKLPLMEKQTGLKLFPTYSFTRFYSYNAELEKHTDRPSCEISVTVMFGSDGTKWPIYMENTPIEMKPGEACIYMGCDIEHYRKPFIGDWHSQAFLHYVNQNGPNAEYKYDKRDTLRNPEV